MKRIFSLILSLGTLTACAGDGDFALTLQGVLTGDAGQRFEEQNRTLIVRLYAEQLTTNCLWARTFPAALDTNGLFSVVLTDADGSYPTDGRLGSCSNLLSAVLAAPDRQPWVGFEDDHSAGELQPRIRLSGQPRALKTFRALSPCDGFTVGGKLTATELTVKAMKTSGDVRSSSVKIVNGGEAAEGLNVGSATVGKSLKVAGPTVAENRVIASGQFGSTAGAVTSASASARTLQVGTGHLASNATVTVGGVAADFPVGSISMWGGSAESIPSGWHICDGEEGTPDLRDRFIVGVGDRYKLGDTDGSAQVTLKTEHIPSHHHLVDYKTHGYAVAVRVNRVYDTVDNHEKRFHKKDTATGMTGGNVPHENRPPYYALYFIQRVK